MIDSLVLFMDVLGSQHWASDPNAQAFLDKLFAATNKNRHLFSTDSGAFSTLTFTDNVVVGCALEGDWADVCVALGLLSLIAGNYQADLAAQGIFVRGAIARGLLYIDDQIAFGPGLVEAHALEGTAIYPRIVLSKELAESAKSYPVSYFSASLKDDYNVDFVRDEDETTFINYLEILPFRTDDRKANLLAHKLNIEQELSRSVGNERVGSKYRWLASYHDFFIDRYYSQWSDMLIDPALLRRKFRMFPIAKATLMG